MAKKETILIEIDNCNKHKKDDNNNAARIY